MLHYHTLPTYPLPFFPANPWSKVFSKVLPIDPIQQPRPITFAPFQRPARGYKKLIGGVVDRLSQSTLHPTRAVVKVQRIAGKVPNQLQVVSWEVAGVGRGGAGGRLAAHQNGKLIVGSLQGRLQSRSDLDIGE